MITGSTDLGLGLLFITVDHDPTTTPTDAPAGSLIIYVVNGVWYHKDDNGSSTNITPTGAGTSGLSGFSSASGQSGYAGAAVSGFSGISGTSGKSGASSFSGFNSSGFSGASGTSGISGISGVSGFSGLSAFSGANRAGLSGISGFGVVGTSGFSGFSGNSGFSGLSAFSGASISGFSGTSGVIGQTGSDPFSGATGWSGTGNVGGNGPSGFSSDSGFSGVSLASTDTVSQSIMERTHMILQPSGFSATPNSNSGNNLFSGLTAIGFGRLTDISDFTNRFWNDFSFGMGLGSSGLSGLGGRCGLAPLEGFGAGDGYMVTKTDWHPIFTCCMATGPASTDLNSITLWCGLVQPSRDPWQDTTPTGTFGWAGCAELAFVYDAGGQQSWSSTKDTVGQWSILTSNGTDYNRIVGVSPIAVNTSYNLRIDCFSTPGSALFYINDSLVQTVSTFLPATLQELGPVLVGYNVGPSSGNKPIALIFKKFHIAQD